MTTYVDDRARSVRSLSRFLVFALVAILGASGLTARLFYLQIIDGGHSVAPSPPSGTVLESVPSIRGLIYDRKGVPLVTNVAELIAIAKKGELAAKFVERFAVDEIKTSGSGASEHVLT